MYKRGIAVMGAACAVALAVSACGDSGGSSADASGGPSTLKIGLLTSLSGPSSSAFVATESGVTARFAAYKEDGGKCASTTFDVVKADDQSTAQGALTATQKLIQQDKAYAVIEMSPFFFGAAQFATTAGKDTPIIGGGFDGAEQWKVTTNNLLPSGLVPDATTTFATNGQYLKMAGGTKVAGIAYAGSPSSKAANESAVKSAEAAGLTRGYINNSVPFGSTDVGAIVLGIIKSKSDVINMAINPDTAFAIVGGLKQAGYATKAVLSATGYGADLLDSAPAVQAGQGMTFSTAWAPNELNTPATQRMAKAMKEHAGSKSGIPGFAQVMGWMAADLLVHGLELAGCDATQAKFLSTVRADKTWDGGGLWPEKRDFSTVKITKQCFYFLRLKGAAFVPEADAMPLCATPVG